MLLFALRAHLQSRICAVCCAALRVPAHCPCHFVPSVHTRRVKVLLGAEFAELNIRSPAPLTFMSTYCYEVAEAHMQGEETQLTLNLMPEKGTQERMKGIAAGALAARN